MPEITDLLVLAHLGKLFPLNTLQSLKQAYCKHSASQHLQSTSIIIKALFRDEFCNDSYAAAERTPCTQDRRYKLPAATSQQLLQRRT